MSDTLQAIARALTADVQQLGTISHNVANINTPGYRGVRTVQRFDAMTAAPGAPETMLDQRDGSLIQTERPLDLALQGEGFFAVEREGRTLLTRSGAFRIDAEGGLINAVGDRVLGEGGPIVLSDLAADEELRIDANGELWTSQERSLGRLDLIAVADAAALRPVGSGAYAYEGKRGEWTGRVVQGALEGANVDAARETIHLIETTRHAESVQRAISIYDKAMDTGVNRLGDN